MNEQLSHTNTRFVAKLFPLIIVCDGLTSPANIGALFRLSEAMGVQEIVFCNSPVPIDSTRLKRTARGTLSKVNYSSSSNIVEKLKELNNDGYETIALEITSESLSLEDLSLKSNKVALVIGNENNGVSAEVLQFLGKSLHITMYGSNSSMNVIQATSIAAYTIIQKLK